jgi:uncharacterized protein YycO
MRTGDIVLEKGTGPISRIIRWFTDSEYSHAAIVVDANILVESHLFSGVSIITMEEIDEEYTVMEPKIPLSEKEKETMRKALYGMIGTPYDLFQIFGYLFSSLFQGKNMMNNPNFMVCSEVIDMAYHSIGDDILPNMFLGDAKPSDLYKAEYFKVKQC